MPDDLDDLAEEIAEDEREANALRTPRDPAAAAAEVMIGNTLAREPDLENAVKTEVSGCHSRSWACLCVCDASTRSS